MCPSTLFLFVTWKKRRKKKRVKEKREEEETVYSELIDVSTKIRPGY